MTPNVEKLFLELKKYEKEGLDSMSWAEYAGQEIYEDIVEKFTLKDWQGLKKAYPDKSINFQTLIISLIPLSNIEYAEIQLNILTEALFSKNIDTAFEALHQISFCFVTAGINYKPTKKKFSFLNSFKKEKEKSIDELTKSMLDGYYVKKELKGVFLTDKKDYLIRKFFGDKFKHKVCEIASECNEVFENEFLEFVKIINETDEI